MSIIYRSFPSSKAREEWFAEDIEENIRPLVLHLRNCGFNTYMSCHHCMYIFVNLSPQWVGLESNELKKAAQQWLSEHHYVDNMVLEIMEHRPDDVSAVLWLDKDTMDLGIVEAQKQFPNGQKFHWKTDPIPADPETSLLVEESRKRTEELVAQDHVEEHERERIDQQGEADKFHSYLCKPIKPAKPVADPVLSVNEWTDLCAEVGRLVAHRGLLNVREALDTFRPNQKPR